MAVTFFLIVFLQRFVSAICPLPSALALYQELLLDILRASAVQCRIPRHELTRNTNIQKNGRPLRTTW